MEDFCREAFFENRENIRVKKESTVVKNLQKIFDAVFKISYEKGFQAMSMRDLSRETRMSMGALYAYFSSKEELLEIIQRQGRAIVNRSLQLYLEADTPPDVKLRNVIKTHLFLSEIGRPWFYFTFMEAKNLNPKELEEVLAMEAYTENILVDILEEGTSTGLFQKRDHSLTACMIKAMQQDWYLKRWKYSKRKISVDQYADFVLAFVEAFIKSKEIGSGGRK
ncbi:MAG: TetR/AcrR family transcriptional regulator [Proteobacteria bacterium]|nr:TetR/AcrR family transcriptional regulator [Pseudomonadota bacterium]